MKSSLNNLMKRTPRRIQSGLVGACVGAVLLARGAGLEGLSLPAPQAYATATNRVSLELWQRGDEPRYIDLTFHNHSKAAVELEIPVEGAGNCYRYFEMEAVTIEGAPVKKPILYAPEIPPYVVKLQPGGIYIHRIQPAAYPNSSEVQKLRKLRVKYTNPLSTVAIVSDWLVLSQK